MPDKKQPNVIVFFTDQQRWDTMGLNGNPMGLTPNLDARASAGTFAAECTTCQPVCGPARSCLQTGQYASQTGVWRNGPALRDDAVTLATQFKAAGYKTSYIGKWHLGGDKCELGPVPEERRGGYEEWLAANVIELVSGPYTTTLWDEQNNPVFLPGYRVDAQTDAAIRRLHKARDNDDEALFLFISYLEPHHQNTSDNYPAPHGYEEKYRGGWIPPDLQALGGSSPAHWAGYCGMVKRLDEAYGRLLDAAESLDSERDTIVCFISDHGCHFKTRNGEYKRTAHESSVRIPLVFTGGVFESGGTLRDAISLVDLPPTLLDAAGVEVPDTMSGRSILPLLRGEREDWPQETFIQFGDYGCAPTGRAVRTRRWKYAVTIPEGQEPCEYSDTYVETHLYDLEADPYELTNLVNFRTHAPVREQLRKRLQARMEEVGEPPCEIVPAEGIYGGQRTIDPPDERVGNQGEWCTKNGNSF